MFDKQFMDFCYDQYKIELENAERFYPRVTVHVAVLTLLGGICVRLLPLGPLLSMCGNTVALLQTALAFLTFLLLAVSFVFVLVAALPRRYEHVAPAAKWQEWHETYDKLLSKDNRSDDNRPILAQGFIDSLIPGLTEAQHKNVAINEHRRRYYRKAVFAVMFATVSISLLALLRLCVYLGVLHP